MSSFDSMQFEKIGNINAKCPYCDFILEKKPKQKRKCPKCRNTIFIKSVIGESEKVLVREDQIPIIMKQWHIYFDAREREKLEQNPQYMQMKIELTTKWGKEPSCTDVQWALANKQLLQHAQSGSWGLYVNTKLDMVKILRKTGNLRKVLELLISAINRLHIGGDMIYYRHENSRCTFASSSCTRRPSL